MVTLLVSVLLLGVSGAKVSVLAPDSLKQSFPDGVPATFATFGFVPHGSYVAGVVLTASSDCCVSCSAHGFNTTHPFVFLVPRGGCDFSTKVHNAQITGAKAVLVLNTKPSQDEDLMASLDRYPTSIPSAMLLFDAGRRFLEHSFAAVNITFESSSLQRSVKVKVVRSLDAHSDLLLINALSAISDFDDFASLEPYFFVRPCQNCSKIDTRCLCENRYCSFENSAGGYIVREAIRQHCVFNLTAMNYTSYIDYMLEWASNCYNSPKAICTSAFTAAGVSAESVQRCYLNSFVGGDERATDNYFLASMASAVDALKVEFYPICIVNNDALYGGTEVTSVRRAICAHMDFTHPACASLFCAPGCWPELKTNLLCDPVCNVKECEFDNGACTHPIVLEGTNQGDGNFTVDWTSSSSQQSSTELPPSPSKTSSTHKGFLDNLPTSPSYYVKDRVPEGCKCNMYQLQFPHCLPECNNAACHYQNWTCSCAPQCSLEMLQNQECDAACNTALCHHDFSSCPVMQGQKSYNDLYYDPYCYSYSSYCGSYCNPYTSYCGSSGSYTCDYYDYDCSDTDGDVCGSDQHLCSDSETYGCCDDESSTIYVGVIVGPIVGVCCW